VELVERALADGHPAVRMSIAAGAATSVLPERARARAERALEQLCHAYPASVLCQYDRAATVHEELSRATEAHVGRVRERQLQTVEIDGGLCLAGEIDQSNEDVLTPVLQTATGLAAETFRLDLSRLTFLSAGGCRAIVAGTMRFRDRDGLLVMTSPQRIVERVLRLLGVDRMHSVAMIGPVP
jgi:anti-anti-sigma factor